MRSCHARDQSMIRPELEPHRSNVRLFRSEMRENILLRLDWSRHRENDRFAWIRPRSIGGVSGLDPKSIVDLVYQPPRQISAEARLTPPRSTTTSRAPPLAANFLCRQAVL